MVSRLPFFYGWLMLVAVMLMSFSSAGARFSFGVFVTPMNRDLGWTLAQLSSVAALNLLVAGLLRPVAGVLVDRFGSKRVALSGLAVAATALILSSQVKELWQFFLVYGVLLSIGYSFASAVTTAPLISRWFVSRRALALSFGSMGSGLGELVIVPIAAVMVVGLGWQNAYQGMAAFILLVVIPVGLLLIRDRPSQLGLQPLGGERDPRGQRKQDQPGLTLREAVRQGDFWRLAFGFLVCGFTMSFASTHFVPFAMEMDFEPMVAAGALGLVGGFSILGSLTTGFMADRVGRKNVLSVVYFLRGMSFIVLMYAHHNPVALYGGAFLLGLSWTSTSPLSAAITADRCGLRHLGSIFGTMYTVMPIGSALGAVTAGYLHDLVGGYEWSLVMSGAAGLLASFVVAGSGGSRAAAGPAAPPDRLPSPLAQPRGSVS
jgi:MFS family permease